MEPAGCPPRQSSPHAAAAIRRVDARAPDWPGSRARVGGQAAAIELADGTHDVRRARHLAAVRARLADEWCAHAISGTRLDTLICDGLLPLNRGARGPARTAAAPSVRQRRTGSRALVSLVRRRSAAAGHQRTTATRVFRRTRSPACHGAAQGLNRLVFTARTGAFERTARIHGSTYVSSARKDRFFQSENSPGGGLTNFLAGATLPDSITTHFSKSGPCGPLFFFSNLPTSSRQSPL